MFGALSCAAASILPAETADLALSWPLPTDCLAGVSWPPGYEFPPILPTDVDLAPVPPIVTARLYENTRPGSVPFIGDSIFQMMQVAKTGPAAVNFGHSGETMRRTMARIELGGLIHNCAGVVMMSGVNDVGRYAALGSPMDAVDPVIGMNRALAYRATRRWIRCHILPVDERVAYAGFNRAIDLINEGMEEAWSKSQAQVEFVDVRSKVVDDTGNLAAEMQFRNDGVHPSRLCEDILCEAIKVKRLALGF